MAFSSISFFASLMPLILIHTNIPAVGTCHSANPANKRRNSSWSYCCVTCIISWQNCRNCKLVFSIKVSSVTVLLKNIILRVLKIGVLSFISKSEWERGWREGGKLMCAYLVSLRLAQGISCLCLLPVVRTMPEPNITLSVLEEDSSALTSSCVLINPITYVVV